MHIYVLIIKVCQRSLLELLHHAMITAISKGHQFKSVVWSMIDLHAIGKNLTEHYGIKR